MGRRVEKTRCNGLWTESKYQSFIRGILRGGSRKWAPINQVKKEAWVSRGKYRCNECQQTVPLTIMVKGKKHNNVYVDHIQPVVNPTTGFVSWDKFIENLFCEKENLQCLCKDCHDIKSQQERQIANERKSNE